MNSNKEIGLDLTLNVFIMFGIVKMNLVKISGTYDCLIYAVAFMTVACLIATIMSMGLCCLSFYCPYYVQNVLLVMIILLHIFLTTSGNIIALKLSSVNSSEIIMLTKTRNIIAIVCAIKSSIVYLTPFMKAEL